MRMWTGPEQRPVAGSFEHGNRFKGFVIGREYYNYWRKHDFLQTNFVEQSRWNGLKVGMLLECWCTL